MTDVGQREGAFATIDESRADRLLQALNASCDRRLCEMQLARGATDGAGFGDDDEGACVGDIHVTHSIHAEYSLPTCSRTLLDCSHGCIPRCRYCPCPR